MARIKDFKEPIMAGILSRKVNAFLKHFNPGSKRVTNATLYSTGKTAMKTENLTTVLSWNAIRDADAYFVVNPGGTKETDITKLVANFVDLDAGRDSKGKYLSGGALRSRKIKMLHAIKDYPLAPSFVVETRNGYQVYWLLSNTKKDRLRLNRWNTVQQRLQKYFRAVGADKKVVKCNQIMRLPHTTWYKKWEGKPAVEVKLHSSNPARKYRLVEFVDNVRPTDAGFVNIVAQATDWSYNKKATVKSYPVFGRPVKRVIVDKHKKTKVVSEAVDEYQHVHGSITKLRNELQELQENEKNTEVLIDVVDFLNQIRNPLHYAGHKFLAKQALKLAAGITQEYGVS